MPTKKTDSSDPSRTSRAKKPAGPRSRKAAPAPTAAPKTARRPRVAASAEAVSPEQRHHMIEVAAYFLAESRGFGPGLEVDDWLAAERTIDHRLTPSV